jgi:hypothetical protein
MTEKNGQITANDYKTGVKNRTMYLTPLARRIEQFTTAKTISSPGFEIILSNLERINGSLGMSQVVKASETISLFANPLSITSHRLATVSNALANIAVHDPTSFDSAIEQVSLAVRKSGPIAASKSAHRLGLDARKADEARQSEERKQLLRGTVVRAKVYASQ